MHNNINNDTYQQQLQQKIERITQQFSFFDMPNLEIYPSPISYFRHRAEFRMWHTYKADEDTLFYAMFEREDNSKKVIEINEFPIASLAINQLMPVLLNKIKTNPILKDKLFQIDFLNSKHGEMLVTLIYHKKLDDTWQAIANDLATELNIKLIGRSRGQKIVLSEDFITEKMSIGVDNTTHEFFYQQIEGGFSQPNAFVCEDMLNFACQCANSIQNKKDLLELYCGNGNFTLPLSLFFNKVLATEMAKASVNAAKWAIHYNQINNIAIARLSAQEFSEAYQNKREFRRLIESGIKIDDYEFNTIFIDPPRAGVDDETLKIVANFEHIIYISCNPETLFDNLTKLTKTHRIERFALFDQFPYTHHIECGVFLIKK